MNFHSDKSDIDRREYSRAQTSEIQREFWQEMMNSRMVEDLSRQLRDVSHILCERVPQEHQSKQRQRDHEQQLQRR